jgi:hypothetical protein
VSSAPNASAASRPIAWLSGRMTISIGDSFVGRKS